MTFQWYSNLFFHSRLPKGKVLKTCFDIIFANCIHYPRTSPIINVLFFSIFKTYKSINLFTVLFIGLNRLSTSTARRFRTLNGLWRWRLRGLCWWGLSDDGDFSRRLFPAIIRTRGTTIKRIIFNKNKYLESYFSFNLVYPIWKWKLYNKINITNNVYYFAESLI